MSQNELGMTPDSGQSLCPKCLRPIFRDTDHFCPDCGVPLTVQATTNPTDQILAEGFAYREASNHPDKPIVVIGIWLLWAPQLLGILVIGIAIVMHAGSIRTIEGTLSC